MGRIVIVELDVKTLEVPRVLNVHALDELFRRHSQLLRREHDGCAVSIVGAEVMHRIPLHALITHPDVRLDVADQMAQMNGAVCVGEGVGDEEFTGHVLIIWLQFRPGPHRRGRVGNFCRSFNR